MPRSIALCHVPSLLRKNRWAGFALAVACTGPGAFSQTTAVASQQPPVAEQTTTAAAEEIPTPSEQIPLISGGGAFTTKTPGGSTSYLPLIEPLIAAPIGPRVLIESRAALGESFTPEVNGQSGYNHTHFAGFTYLQADFFATKHLTVVFGDYLLPFNSYNERLSPVWINDFQDGPLIASLGLFSSGSGLGGQVRGSAIQRHNYSVDYAAFFSARSGNQQFQATRGSGGRVSVYVPKKRLDFGLSYDRSLQATHENFYGGHLWWQPKDTGFRFLSEYARGHHAQGYWFETAYRTSAFGGENSWIGRLEPLFRMQQTFRRDNLISDGLPLVNVQRAEFGLDYNLPHATRILTSYSRQFSAQGNENIWETAIVYRFLFPAFKVK